MLNAADFTSASCSSSFFSSFPLLASQIRAELSSDDVTIFVPSVPVLVRHHCHHDGRHHHGGLCRPFAGHRLSRRIADPVRAADGLPGRLVLARRLDFGRYRRFTENRDVLLDTILFSQTLGTALGDWMADTNDLGYERGALVFAAGLAVVAAAYFWTNVSRTLLFWSAFILTRPLGATVGDFLDKPVADGGLAFGRFYASAILVALIVACIVFLPQRAGRHPGAAQEI